MNKGCLGSQASFWLLWVGGVNWGLVGLGYFFGGSDWNVVHLIFGSWMWLEYLIYILVGAAAVMKPFHCKCKRCTAARCGDCGCVSNGKPTTPAGSAM